MEVSDEQFAVLIARAMDELPQHYIEQLNNVAVTYADTPTPEQLAQQGIREGELLLGLYEGIPQTRRGAGYNLVLPDKITLFKHSIGLLSHNEQDLFERIKRTLWHEIAHHYGLDHDRIHFLEDKDPHA
ncbi:MAG TPA: metallopeptidase family protein [Candidatus Saccharibacteria bacterium]|nr:metallopeptidase family protein [Candidatus Saccharibacteria bacterium]